ncbi:alpha/beta fold hydrolase [Actinopolymorpha rutila]|uniref:Pimeloyl-ACP methyl ester carboxylesterase n=1 Tax=Actinopolymorpha rutila TaxID=446787 RepID=A0A852ZNY6_9ACTN|nr:alpha/beta hydrolase [Actinopolymorpha rutila]NYH93262.1 pimeloyl-ACP methyl ester carboxylesterase [Actinopolymorpha rutila]
MTSQNAGPVATRPRRTAGTLEVPGAHLYYETWGFERRDAPLLLMIPGGLGDAGFFSSVGPALANDYRVATYDRRGNSRSTVATPYPEARIDEQTADALALLDLLGDPGHDDRSRAEDEGEREPAPAYVFGGSGGAIIGLDLVARHPHRVHTLVAHEPPVVTVLPDAAEHLARFEEIRGLHRTEGTEKAMAAFVADYAGGDEQDFEYDPELPPDRDIERRFAGNFDTFMGTELLPFVRFEPDLAALRTAANAGTRLVLAGGERSSAHYPYRASATLAERLGPEYAEFVEFPGDHSGYLGRPRAFAEKLRAVLRAG